MRVFVNKLKEAFRSPEPAPGPAGEEAEQMTGIMLPDYRMMERHRVSGAGREREIGPVLRLDATRRKAEDGKKTIVVMGGYRGGTSMVAGLLRLMGVFMGFELGMRNNEDLDFQGADVDRALHLIGERNRMFDLWGWKDPGTIYTIGQVQDHLRNPHFIVIFRDLMAVAQNEIAKNVYEFEEAAWRAADQQMRLTDFVLRSEHPVLAVSYERATKNKEQFVKNLADFLNIDFPQEDLEKTSPFIQRFGRRVSLYRRRSGLDRYGSLEERHGVREIRSGKEGRR